MIDLQESRTKIDAVDKKLLELFEYRMQLTTEVADYKRAVGKAVYDPEREKEKLASLEALTKNEKNRKAVSDFFSQIMSLSRRMQYSLLDTKDYFGFREVDAIRTDSNTRIAFYGEKGSYTEQAMREYFNKEATGISMGTFTEVMQAVKEGVAEYGVLPIENSSTGSLSDIYDLLAEFNNTIIGEHVVKVEHCLWGLPGAKLSDITKVYSHRQGLLQCSDFLKQSPKIRPVEGGSTAGCAKRILEEGDITQAAIASRIAGEYYGLQLLQDSIHKEANNATRFIIISNLKMYQKGANSTSICFELPHKTGSLYHMLSHLIYNNINMTRIESRPVPDKAFEYRFFIDLEGCIDQPVIQNALYSIKEEAIDMKILGCFLPVR
ncbi:MAG: chorismate mutase [Lachnospiraceae bacterium]|jgi:chorismate mutase/prephenate dehydratase|nr:chorismate mutase [Lachnospiraceae bacterium]